MPGFRNYSSYLKRNRATTSCSLDVAIILVRKMCWNFLQKKDFYPRNIRTCNFCNRHIIPFFERFLPMKDTTRNIILSISPMSEASLKAIIGLVDIHGYQKNKIFIEKDKRNSYEYFVLEGVCRSFLLNPDGEEISISFFTDNSIISPYTTRTSNGLSNVNFQALTPLKVGAMNAEAFEELMVENLEIREFGNIVLRNELKQKVEKEIGMASLTAKERLLKFRQQYPLLENTVPHTTISTYLGITNISLSRLRNELVK